MPTTITGATRSAIDAILKDRYLGPIRDQLNASTVLMSRLRRDTENIDGRIGKIPLRVGRNRGILATSEGGTLPTPGKQSYAVTEIPMAFNYGLIQVTGQSMGASRTNLGAFIRALDGEVRGMVEDLKNDINRQMFGDGSGRIAVAAGAFSTNTLTVRAPWDWNNQTPTLKNIEVGDLLAYENINTNGLLQGFATAADAGGGVFAAVTAVNLANKTFDVAGAAATVAAGDGIVRGPDTSSATGAIGSGAETGNFRQLATASLAGTKKEMMGLVGIVNGPAGWPAYPIGTASYASYTAIWDVTEGDMYGGNYGGADIVRAKLQNYQNASVWYSNMFFNAGVLRSLDTDLLQQAFDACELNGQATPTIGITTYGCRRRYIDLLVPDRRFVGEYTYKLDGGWKAVDYNGIPIVVDKDCPEGNLFFLSEPNLSIFQMSDFHWLDKDGSILKYVDRKDAWEAVLAWYAELATDRRNAHACIGDIAIS